MTSGQRSAVLVPLCLLLGWTLPWPWLGVARPDLVVVAVVLLAVSRPALIAVAAAIALGMADDVLGSQVLGSRAVSLAVIAYLTGRVSAEVDLANLRTRAALLLAALVAEPLLSKCLVLLAGIDRVAGGNGVAGWITTILAGLLMWGWVARRTRSVRAESW